MSKCRYCGCEFDGYGAYCSPECKRLDIKEHFLDGYLFGDFIILKWLFIIGFFPYTLSYMFLWKKDHKMAAVIIWIVLAVVSVICGAMGVFSD